MSSKLQDKLSQKEAIKNVLSSVKARHFGSTRPTVHYSDEQSDINIGYPSANQLHILEDNEGNPFIIANTDPSLPDHVIVCGPEKRHQIAFLPDYPDRTPTQNTKARLESIREIAGDLEPNIPEEKTKETISELHQRWRKLTETPECMNPQTLRQSLKDLRNEIHDTARAIITPGYGSAEHRDNAKNLVKLAFLACDERSEFKALEFRTPNGTATRANKQPPNLIVQETPAGNNVNIDLAHADAEGMPTQDVAIKLKGVPKNETAPNIARAVMQIPQKEKDVGRPTNAFNGLLTYSVNDQGTPLSSGHWLSQEGREEATHHSPVKLSHRDAKNQPLFDVNGYRTIDDTDRMRNSVVYLIHGDTVTPDETLWMAELAFYDGDYLVEPNLDDISGSAQIQIQDTIFNECTNEDIKRHIAQKVMLSSLDLQKCQDIADRVRSTSWTKADDKLDQAFEEAAIAGEMSPGM